MQQTNKLLMRRVMQLKSVSSVECVKSVKSTLPELLQAQSPRRHEDTEWKTTAAPLKNASCLAPFYDAGTTLSLSLFSHWTPFPLCNHKLVWSTTTNCCGCSLSLFLSSFWASWIHLPPSPFLFLIHTLHQWRQQQQQHWQFNRVQPSE